MRTFIVTLIQGSQRTVRKIVAPDTFSATEIAIGLMPNINMPLSIYCKPEERTAA